MSCIISHRGQGFTLIELLTVISLVALVVVMSGNSLLDQIRAQQVSDAIETARDMATSIEQIRSQLRDTHASRFDDGATQYRETLEEFLDDMDVAPLLKSRLPQFVTAPESVMGESAGDVYTVTLTENGTFVTVELDDEYSDFDFYTAGRPSGSASPITATCWLVNSGGV